MLVATSPTADHIEHLAMVFDRLRQFGIVLNPSKCVFGVPYIEFPRRLVETSIIHSLPSKVTAVREFPPLSSKRKLE
ncbi:unnamed protein product [Dibothriocephalus latus]|uniref:Reverse transcriptase domain-containing protein n=1 Tax=Dibothriocephalus latus TaxID=60516 RepID=A0A3P7LAX8_DIBLA|nr:unnamed protein product [Dibothriocephalus latus]